MASHIHWLTRDDRTAIAVFVLALWLPLIATWLAPSSDESFAEHRKLAAAPRLSLALEPLLALPEATTAYYDDHIAFRDMLIRWRGYLWIRLLRTSPSPHLLVGNDGWLFNAGQHLRDPDRMTGRVPVAELERWSRSFEERDRWLAQQGIVYLLVLVPMKSTIYPEHLPRWAVPVEDPPFAQLERYLAEHTSVAVLDLEPALRAAKSDSRLYHRTDIHWNREGSYVGYRAILDALRGRVRPLESQAPISVHRERRWIDGLGLVQQLHLEDLLREEELEVRPAHPRSRPNKTQKAAIRAPRRYLRDVVLGAGDGALPSAVVFRDSFATGLMPFLSEHFDRIVYRFHMDVDPRLVRRERPDVVIHEIWAGSLYEERWGPGTPREWRTPSRPWIPTAP